MNGTGSWEKEREKGTSAERWSAPLVFMNSGATELPASDLISKPPNLPVTFLLRFPQPDLRRFSIGRDIVELH